MWMKVDDRMHAHRKTRAVLKSARPDKRVDAAPLGLWLLAGSWAALNGTGGWVPEFELDRFDDDWETLVPRLVKAEYWHPEERGGEAGYAFVDWEQYNPSHNAAESGGFGAHKRWHADRGVVSPGCPHCPSEPDAIDPDGGPIDPDWEAIDPYPDRGPMGTPLGGDMPPLMQIDSNTRPEPHPMPELFPHSCSSDAADATPTERMSIDDDFASWWECYPRKVGKGQAIRAYRTARKKTDHATLVAAITQQTPKLVAKGPDFCPYPATWLNGERWNDELAADRAPVAEERDDSWISKPAPDWMHDAELVERLIEEANNRG